MKTSVCKEILKKLGEDDKSSTINRNILILCQSDFYKVDENLSNKEVDKDLELNYDHPGWYTKHNTRLQFVTNLHVVTSPLSFQVERESLPLNECTTYTGNVISRCVPCHS